MKTIRAGSHIRSLATARTLVFKQWFSCKKTRLGQLAHLLLGGELKILVEMLSELRHHLLKVIDHYSHVPEF